MKFEKFIIKTIFHPMTQKLSSIAGSTMLVNCMIGVGVIRIALPFEYLNGYVGSLALLVSTLITFLTIYFLIYSIKKTKYESYDQLCKQIFKKGDFAYNMMVILLCYGCSISYFIYAVQFLCGLLHATITKTDYFNYPLGRFFVGLALIVPLCILSNLKSLDKLKFMSIVVVISTVYVAILMVVLYFMSKGIAEIEFSKDSISGFGSVAKGLPPIVFALGCQQTALSIYNSLNDQSMKGSLISMGGGCFMGFFSYLIIGLFGYLSIRKLDGNDFLSIFLTTDNAFTKAMCRQYPWLKIFMLIAVGAFIFCIIGAFPIQTFVARMGLITGIRGNTEKKENNKMIVIISNIVHFSALLCLLTFGINPGNVLNIISSAVSPVISFIFPSLIFIRTKKGMGVMKICAILLSLSALTLGAFCTFESLRGLSGK